MKAVVLNRYGGPEVLEYVDLPKPVPAADQVLVKAVSIGVGKPDYLVRSGLYPWTKGVFPFVPGLEMSGVIEAVGKEVNHLSIGQKVHLSHLTVCSCYAEYKTVPAKHVVVLPDHVDLISAGAMMYHYMAWSLLKEACRGTDNKHLYISGAAGGYGSAVVQLAPFFGFSVIASAGSNEKCQYLRELGAAHAFNYRENDPVEKVLALTEGRGVDIVLTQVLDDQFYRQFEMLADLGLIVIYSLLGSFPEGNLVEYLVKNFSRCHGVRVYSAHIHDRQFERLVENKKEAFQLLAEEKVKPYIYKTFPLAEAKQAHQLLDSRDFYGKIVLTVE